MKRSVATVLQWALIAFVVLLLVSEASVYVPPLKGSRTLTVSFQTSPGAVSIRSTLWSSYTGTYLRAVDWVNGSSAIRTVYYYYDANYPESYSNRPSWYGIPWYLNLIASSRDLSLTITVVNATQLASVVTNPSTAVGGLLVFASGAFPATVYSNSSDLIRPWLEEGGRMIWIGDAVGYYSAQSGHGLTRNNTLGWNATKAFLGMNEIFTPTSFGNVTPISLAVNLGWMVYRIPRYGFNISEVVADGGVVVGNVQNGYTNGALLPVGRGAMLNLAASMVEGTEEAFAVSLVNILQLGLLYPTTSFVSQQSSVVGAGTSWTWNETVPDADPALDTSWNLCVLSEQVDQSALFGTSSCEGGLPGP